MQMHGTGTQVMGYFSCLLFRNELSKTENWTHQINNCDAYCLFISSVKQMHDTCFYNHYVHLEINYKSGFVFIFASNPCYLTASEMT